MNANSDRQIGHDFCHFLLESFAEFEEVGARFHPDSEAHGGLTVEAKQGLRRIGVTAGDSRHIRQREETVIDPQVDGFQACL
jgi:hypothetical protein